MNQKSLLIGAVFLSVGCLVLSSWTAGRGQAVLPYRVVVPKYDIYVPKACEGDLQRMFPSARTDLTIPVDTFLKLKQKVSDCGGHMVEEKP